MTTTEVPARIKALGWIPEVGFGDKLRRVRLSLGMNQAEFAASIGMKGAAYAHHELKAEYPRNAQMIANSVELRHGVPAWWLMGEDAPVTRQYLAPHTAPAVSIGCLPIQRLRAPDFIPLQQAA